jgi:hypothetical protein
MADRYSFARNTVELTPMFDFLRQCTIVLVDEIAESEWFTCQGTGTRSLIQLCYNGRSFKVLSVLCHHEIFHDFHRNWAGEVGWNGAHGWLTL